MDAQFTPVLPIADVHLGLAAWLDLRLRKIRTYTEHGAGAPLTLKTMTGDHKSRFTFTASLKVSTTA
jgi:hypothetical protein